MPHDDIEEMPIQPTGAESIEGELGIKPECKIGWLEKDVEKATEKRSDHRFEYTILGMISSKYISSHHVYIFKVRMTKIQCSTGTHCHRSGMNRVSRKNLSFLMRFKASRSVVIY